MTTARPKNFARDVVVGAMFLAAVVLLGYMAARIGSVGSFRGGREVTMRLADANGLVETTPIAVAGVKIGAISTIEVEDGIAKIVARVRPDLAIHADATAFVRAKSLLGERFVEIDPGSAEAGPLAVGAEIRTLPSADIDRLTGVLARAAEAVDPEDLRAIAHGLAVALSSEKGKASAPAAFRELAQDLHLVATSLAKLAAVSGDASSQIKPLLARLDELTAKAGKTIDGLQPTVQRLPGTLDHLERISKRLEALFAKGEKLDPDFLLLEIRKIFEEEGIYVRVRPRKVGKEKGSGEPE